MFDLGWSKLIIIAMVAIVVVGPKDLPSLLRTIGKFVGQIRRQADEFRRQFDEAMRDTELDQIRRDVAEIKRSAHESVQEIGRAAEEGMKPLETATADINNIGAGGSSSSTTSVADATIPPVPVIPSELPQPSLPASAPTLPKAGA